MNDDKFKDMAVSIQAKADVAARFGTCETPEDRQRFRDEVRLENKRRQNTLSDLTK